MLLLSSADISSDADYTLTVDGTEVEYSTDIMSGGPGGGGPGGEQPPEEEQPSETGNA